VIGYGWNGFLVVLGTGPERPPPAVAPGAVPGMGEIVVVDPAEPVALASLALAASDAAATARALAGAEVMAAIGLEGAVWGITSLAPRNTAATTATPTIRTMSARFLRAEAVTGAPRSGEGAINDRR
jgi:hypothetical protein